MNLERFNKLSPITKIITKISGFIVACGIIYTGYTSAKKNMASNIDEYIHKQTKIVLEKEKKSNKTGYRHQKAKIQNIPIDSLLYYDNQMFIHFLESKHTLNNLEELNIDKQSLSKYLLVLSDFIWRELEYNEYRGVKFGRSSNGLVYYKYKGFIFEAYYKGSTDSYWFKDSYGDEIQCL